MMLGNYAATGEIEVYALIWRWCEVDMVLQDEDQPPRRVNVRGLVSDDERAAGLSLLVPDREATPEAWGVLAQGPTVSVGGLWVLQGQDLDQALWMASQLVFAAENRGLSWARAADRDEAFRSGLVHKVREQAAQEWRDRARDAWEVNYGG